MLLWGQDDDDDDDGDDSDDENADHPFGFVAICYFIYYLFIYFCEMTCKLVSDWLFPTISVVWCYAK